MPALINTIVDEVILVLNERQKERYFDSVILLYSLIENLLKWTVYADILRKKYHTKKRVTKNVRREQRDIHQFLKRLGFYETLRIALVSGLIDYRLYEKVEGIRTERNNVVHRLWTYQHRHNRAVIRKKLEKLILVTGELMAVSDMTARRIKVDLVWDLLSDL
jgi:hypothetical protein